MNEDMPDTGANRARLARFCAQEVAKDRKIPHLSRAAVAAVVAAARVRAGDPARLTTRLRGWAGWCAPPATWRRRRGRRCSSSGT